MTKKLASVELMQPDERVWRTHSFGDVEIYFFGYALVLQNVLGEIGDAFEEQSRARFETAIQLALTRLDGHFALIARQRKRYMMAVDRVRSTPLFFSMSDERLVLGAHAPSVTEKTGQHGVDPVAAACIAMSGYTVGTDTLHPALFQLAPGECLVVDNGVVTRTSYHQWRPWTTSATATSRTHASMQECTLSVLDKVKRSADGRRLAIALSAGLDSRVIASGLAHLGGCDVTCYAYGLPGNYEARASKAIADKLGLRWHFIPLTRKRQRAFIWSEVAEEYLTFADSRAATPVLNDLSATINLLEAGYIDADTLILNGNSGDFISGMHIVDSLRGVKSAQTLTSMRNDVVQALISKHFRLWDVLATTARDTMVAERLRREIDHMTEGNAPDPNGRHGLYEAMEFRDRQSKFVVARQRIYDYLGLGWRLPLWDNDYLDYWEHVPLKQKANQALYKDALKSADWGGVWGQQWWPERRVSPNWMRLGVRPLMKGILAPFGRTRWHEFERRFLYYWMDLLALHGALPYAEVAMDTRGARHFIAWHTQRYLLRVGRGYDGQEMTRKT